MKWWKSIIFFILFAVAVMMPGEVSAAKNDSESGKAAEDLYGAQQMISLYDTSMCRVIEVPYSKKAAPDIDLFDKRVLYADATQSPWKEYGNQYVYSRLTAGEQKLYDRFEAESLSILAESKDVGKLDDAGGNQVPTMPMINYTEFGLTREQAVDVAWLFFYSNPQYYFLENTIYYMTVVDQGALGFKVYDEFQNGSIRSDYTVRVSEKLSAWVADAASQTGGYEKIKRAHDIVCDSAVYQSVPYDQSISSVILFGGNGVCTAYALCFEAICNKLGYQTLLVTSEGHAWNMVELGSQWYQNDCTWDDKPGSWIYDYFLVSDSTMKSKDQNANHVLVSMWNTIAPTCPSDYNNLNLEATCQMNHGEETITLAAGDSNAVIYYTLDGTAPSSASETYTGSFTVKDACIIRAVAVSGSQTGDELKVNIHKVTIQSGNENAGTLHGVTLLGDYFLISEKEKVELTAEAKSGYTFEGWTDETGAVANQVSYVVQNVTGNRTIQMKYNPETYTITYHLDGGVLKKDNPVKYNIESKIVLNNPEKKGYLFKGWYQNGTKLTTIENRIGNLEITAKWKKVTVGKAVIKKIITKTRTLKIGKLSSAEGYEISCSSKKNFPRKKTQTYAAKSNTVKLKGKINGTCYLRVRAFRTDSCGNKIYGAYSKVKAIS